MFVKVTVGVSQISLIDLKMVRNAAAMAQSGAFTFLVKTVQTFTVKTENLYVKSPEIPFLSVSQASC